MSNVVQILEGAKADISAQLVAVKDRLAVVQTQEASLCAEVTELEAAIENCNKAINSINGTV